MVTSEKLRELASIGRALMPHEMTELADQLDKQQEKLTNQADRLLYLNRILQSSLDAAGVSRPVNFILEECMKDHSDNPTIMFNLREMRSVAQRLLNVESDLEQYKSVNRELAVEAPTRDAEEVIRLIDANEVSRFSFVEVRQLIDHFKAGRSQAGRRVRGNLKEIHDLLKGNGELFYPAEMRMMRDWGRAQVNELDNLKHKLGRAFADPVAWKDRSTGFLLKDADKKEMLKAGSINADHFQLGLHARPDNFTIPEDWMVKDGYNQFHAGENFHTKSDGTWWCGAMFSNLTAANLQHILETTLGDLRALYLKHPEGINK